MASDDHIGANTPLRLKDAAKRAFPDGSISETTLRREAKRGRLVTERIANKDYTTLNAIEEIGNLCRAAPKDRTSFSEQTGQTAERRLDHPRPH